MTLFATGFILAMMSVLHLLGDNPRWPDVALKVLAVVSIGAIGTYAGTQATEHRREARLARRNALDLVTLSLFVARLAPDSRDLILRNFGMQRFASAPDNAAPQDPALGISSQLVALAGKVADIAKARP